MSPDLGRSLAAALAVLLGAAPATEPASANEPNDTVAESTNVGSTRSVSDQIDFSTPAADTTLGFFGSAGELIAVDDDGSLLGNGFASGLNGFDVNADGAIPFAVSGFGDFDFDGLVDGSSAPHGETGDFEAFLSVFDASGGELARQRFDGTLSPGGVQQFLAGPNPAWIGGTFELELLNFFGPASDVDFWTFDGLPAGAGFVAEVVTGDFDTLLGWFDAGGDPLAVDDDGGDGVLSRLTGVTPAGGAVTLGVSAFPDRDFTGVHSASGGYTLTLTVIPEPLSATGALVAIAWVSLVRRRRC